MSLFLDLATQVLQQSRHPMSVRAIWAYADANGLLSDKLAGKTPIQTLKSKLSVHIRTFGDSSPFVRTGPGRFYLRDLVQNNQVLYNAPHALPAGTSENVLVFSQSLLDKLGRFQGIKANAKTLYKQIVTSKECQYKQRLLAETDNNFKQIVTYVLITSESRVLAFKRGNYTLSDKLLRGAQCIGFGGHVTDQDGTLFNIEDRGVRDSAIRELVEEINIQPEEISKLSLEDGLKLIGALNDDSSDVGKRHFAFVFEYTPKISKNWDKPIKGEKAVTNLRWIDTKASGFSIAQFEYWSQLCLREYFPSFLRLQSEYLIRRKPKSSNAVFCIIGPIGSGKTEATSVFTKEYGYKEINSGKVLAGLLGIQPVPLSPREVFQKKAAEFIKSSDGPNRLASAIVANIDSDKVLIDGIRNPGTLIALRESLKTLHRQLVLIYIHTPFDIALSFYKKRENSEISADDFLRLRTSDSEKEVERLIESSDVVIYNWIGRDNYRVLIGRIMKQICEQS